MSLTILTWTQFLVNLKGEADLNDTSQDANLFAWANEILAEIAGSTENLRDFRIDITQAIANVNTVNIDSYYVRNIEQIYYQKYSGASFVRRWDIREQHTQIYPSPVAGAPDSYSIQQTNNGTAPRLTLTFYPIGSATVADKVQLIGTVFPQIVDGTTLMPWVSLYPMLTRSVLQRLQMERNLSPERIKTYDEPIARAASAAGMSSKDRGDSNDS